LQEKTCKTLRTWHKKKKTERNKKHMTSLFDDEEQLLYAKHLAQKEMDAKPLLDSFLSSITLCDHLTQALTKKFQPHPNLPTPFLADLKSPPCNQPKKLELQNPDPRDACIVSVDEPHTYFINGNCDNIVSSTGFVHAFFPHFDTESAAKKILTSKSFLTTCHRKSHKYFQCVTFEDVLSRWNWWRDLGTMLHDNIENFLNDFPFTVHEENKTAFGKFMDFYNDRMFWHWNHFRTEWAVFDEETRLAGKIDYVGRDPVTGELIILDWKRVGAISDSCASRWTEKRVERGFGACADLENCKYITYSLQLNVYKWILEKNYGVYVKKMYLIQVHPKVKTPTIYKVPDLQVYVVKMAAYRKTALAKSLQRV
jgi:hypothetical protein